MSAPARVAQTVIHPTALVDPAAQLEPGVTVGPFCIVEGDTVIGSGTVLEAGTIVRRHSRIGRDNRIGPYAVLGGEPMDLKFRGEVSYLQIGDRNTIKDFTTINRGTDNGGGWTRVGDDNFVMAYVHITHDCQVGNNTIIPNGMQMAGHVVVEDFVTFGASVNIHQFCRIGRYAMVGMTSKVTRDVLPYTLADGHPALHYSLNTIGLRRRGVPSADHKLLSDAFRLIRHGESLDGLQAVAAGSSHLAHLLEFLALPSSRGVSGFASKAHKG